MIEEPKNNNNNNKPPHNTENRSLGKEFNFIRDFTFYH